LEWADFWRAVQFLVAASDRFVRIILTFLSLQV